MPGEGTNEYTEPNQNQFTQWGNALDQLLSAEYNQAAIILDSIDYELISFIDTTTIDSNLYYIIESVGSNYWGTYAYNPNYHRPLVIQSPHPKKDANTGHQGLHVFIESQSFFYCLAGTNRCNSLVSSSCTGTTTGCSGSSEPYKISDLPHTVESCFQKTTQVLFEFMDDSYFIQLHGFTKLPTDPYVILSNGTQIPTSPDYHSIFADKLYEEDTVLTFKIAHVDTDWTRLRGFWNTQGRMINNSNDHCNTNADTTNGRFFHVEQERIRLRNDVTGWNKVSNALVNTFECSDTVTNITGHGMNSLRTAVNCASANDTIYFSSVLNNDTIELSQPFIQINKPLYFVVESTDSIYLSNKLISNTQDLMKISSQLKIIGLDGMGKSTESMVISIEPGGSIEILSGEFIQVNFKQFD